MRIAINCIKVNPSYVGGVNTYTFGLIDGLINANNGHHLYLFVCRKNKHLFKKFNDRKDVFIIIAEKDNFMTFLKKAIKGIFILVGNQLIFRFINDFMFKNVAKIIEQNSDIIYIPTTLLDYYSYKKTVLLSMHDIQHVHYPEYFTKKSLIYRKIVFELSAKYSNYFQASSQFIKDDLLIHFSYLKENQIIVIPEGVNISEFREPKEDVDICAKYNLPQDFIFFPGQLWKHKNHITVLKAIKILKNVGKNISLVLTGQKYSTSKEMFDYIKQNNLKNIYYLGKIPFKELVALYQKSSFFITAVLYESSSLPILEAAAAGTPIIASKTPANFEMSQILSINLFDPLNENELAELINNLWENGELISEQVKHNLENISYYSWRNAADKYFKFFTNKICYP